MLFQKLTEVAATAPATSGISDNGTFHSYASMIEPIERLAGGLLSRGVELGDAVALLMPNSADTFISAHALFAIGAVAVPLNPGGSRKELEAAAKKCGVAAIIARPQFLPVAEKMAEDLGRAVPIFIAGGEGENSLETLKRHAPANLRPLDPELHSIYLFSSGSTGRPKIVPNTQRTAWTGGYHSTGLLGITADDRIFNSLPSFTAYGFMTFVGGEVWRGGSTVLWSDPQPIMMSRDRMLGAIVAERVTVMPGVPFLYDLLSSTPADHDLSRIRMAYSSGVPMRKSSFDAFHARYGIAIRQAYGSTEAAMISLNTEDDAAAVWDSVGRPVAPVEVEVLPSLDAPAPGIGEMLVKTPGLTPGYLSADPASTATFRDGGWVTGDLGFIDDDGILRLTGRAKLIIEVSGMKVDPIEVEDALVTHPAVAEAAVVGVPDPRTGEQRIKAVVVRKSEETAEAILRHVRGKLTPYKVPAVLEFRDSLPRSGSGKILRGQLID